MSADDVSLRGVESAVGVAEVGVARAMVLHMESEGERGMEMQRGTAKRLRGFVGESIAHALASPTPASTHTLTDESLPPAEAPLLALLNTSDGRSVWSDWAEEESGVTVTLGRAMSWMSPETERMGEDVLPREEREGADNIDEGAVLLEGESRQDAREEIGEEEGTEAEETMHEQRALEAERGN